MLVALPILIPLATSALCLLVWGRVRVQAALAAVAMFAHLLTAVTLLWTVRAEGILHVDIGGWRAPFGITLVADIFAGIMVVLTAIVGLAAVLFSMATIDRRRARFGHYPLMLSLLGAVSGAFLTGDLFNLYVWFELLLLSSFVLLTLGGSRAQLEGAIKYVTLNLLSSVLFLAGVGLVYGFTGTLNMADLALRLDALEDPREATMLGLPLLVAFGIKAAVFPFFFWLPASYHTPPVVVSALFAGLLTKVGVYAIIRAMTLLFDQEQLLMGEVLLAIAALTMLTGVLGAIAQNDMRRILSFHIVSQIGYMLMGLGVALVATAHATGPDAGVTMADAAVIALAGSVFYILHHIIVKTNLFLISGAVLQHVGTSSLPRLGGLAGSHSALAGLFLVSALSLAGIPVLSGFWAKLTLVRGGLQAGSHVIVAVSLLVSLLTLFSMMKIWTEAFWKSMPDTTPIGRVKPLTTRRSALMMVPIVGLAALTTLIGLGAAWAYDLAHAAAEQLIDADAYIQAVLGAGREVRP